MVPSKTHVGWQDINGQRCLVFTFPPLLKADDAKIAIDRWRSLLGEANGEQVTIVWDALHMDDYEQAARSLWLKMLLETRSQLATIWLVTGSPFIRVGGRTLGVVTRLHVRACKTLDEVT